MALVRQVEIRTLDSFQGGMAQFYTPQSSHKGIGRSGEVSLGW